MKIQYHILNGDALKEQFPQDLEGEQIIMRECLVDGDVQGNTLEDFFKNRAAFIANAYEDVTEEGYFQKTSTEFKKIESIPQDAEINLWFEDDLFCQVNFWFVCYLLNHYQKKNEVFLVRPKEHTQYGFAYYKPEELNELFENRLPIQIDAFKDLWVSYQNKQIDQLLDLAKTLTPFYPFLLPAVEAHMARIPQEGKSGRPIESLKRIMAELQTDKFGPVFQEFCKQESIYGFGDLQVKRLFDELVG